MWLLSLDRIACVSADSVLSIRIGSSATSQMAVERPAAADGRSLVRMALDATGDDVRFIPQWGKNRMRGMLESRPDWCLSRQRAWGLPIPAFYDDQGRPLLTAVHLFDVYRGEQIGAGKKSLAYSLTFQSEERTLTDKVVARQQNGIVKRLEREMGAKLRG